MKKLSLLLTLTLTLSWCFWNSDQSQSGLILQDRGDFSILMPENWSEITAADIPTPKSGEVALAYSSSSERQWYLNNVIILKTPSTPGESQASLMKSSLRSLQTTTVNFSLIEEKTVAFADEQSGSILTYRAKYNDATPEVIYIQTARVCGENNYHLTLSLAEQLDSYDRYEYILQTFRCN